MDASIRDLSSMVTIKLTKDNYDQWKYLMLPCIESLNGLGHINSRPAEDDEWLKKDLLLIIFINSTISEQALSTLTLVDAMSFSSYSCKELWETLKLLFSTPADSTSISTSLHKLKLGSAAGAQQEQS